MPRGRGFLVGRDVGKGVEFLGTGEAGHTWGQLAVGLALKGTRGEGPWRGSRAGGGAPRSAPQSAAAQWREGGRGDRLTVAGPCGPVTGGERAFSRSLRRGQGVRLARRLHGGAVAVFSWSLQRVPRSSVF